MHYQSWHPWWENNFGSKSFIWILIHNNWIKWHQPETNDAKHTSLVYHNLPQRTYLEECLEF